VQIQHSLSCIVWNFYFNCFLLWSVVCVCFSDTMSLCLLQCCDVYCHCDIAAKRLQILSYNCQIRRAMAHASCHVIHQVAAPCNEAQRDVCCAWHHFFVWLCSSFSLCTAMNKVLYSRLKSQQKIVVPKRVVCWGLPYAWVYADLRCDICSLK